MKISESMLCEYAKKIYGFAYSKTRNIADAEDLSQDILTVLVGELSKKKEIEYPDSYIYRICCYTWSKYLRRNVKTKCNVPFDDKILLINDGKNIAEDFENAQLLENLRKEITYLGKMRREIMISHYYEGKTSSEIAERLSLSPSTVRWHLGESRKKLKERLDMEQNEIYRPERLRCHYTGSITLDSLFMQLKKDALLQNICIVCYNEPLSIEEIARKLSVAAVYIEDKIERLVYMDYLSEQNGKYRTNFHIKNTECVLNELQYMLDNIEPIAKKIYDFCSDLYNEICKDYNFGVSKNKVISDAVMLTCEYSWQNALNKINKNWYTPPKRRDGSEHWIFAYLIDNEYLNSQTHYPDRTCDYLKVHFGKGIASQNAVSGNVRIKCRHCDAYMHNVRNIEAYQLIKLQQVNKIIEDGDEISENEKYIISSLVNDGLVAIENDKPKLLIPYITKRKVRKYIPKVIKLYKKSGIEELVKDYIIRYGEVMENHIPDHLSEENRLHSKYYRAGITYETIFLLIEKGLIEMWTEEEKQSSLFVVWEE